MSKKDIKFEEKEYSNDELKKMEGKETNIVDDVIKSITEPINKELDALEEVSIYKGPRKPIITVDMLDNIKSTISNTNNPNTSLSVNEYPHAMYKFSVSGNNGSRITPDKDDVSPTNRCVLSLTEARDAILRGFILRWTHPDYINSEWYNAILNKYTIDMFAAFIAFEIECGRLSYSYI